MPRRSRIPARNEVTDETMMLLSVAAEVAVAHGVILSATTKALKREADLGRLAVYEVFGRLHTTLGDIKTMIRQSVVSPKKAVPVTGPRAASAPVPQGVKWRERDLQDKGISPSKEVIRSLLAAAKQRATGR